MPGGKTYFGFTLVILACNGYPYDLQYSSLGGGVNSTTSNAQDFWTPLAASGKFTKMKVRVQSINDFGVDVPVKLRVNGVATQLAVTVPAYALNTTYTSSQTANVDENDLVDILYDVTGAGGYEVMFLTMAVEFKPA